MAAVRKTAVNPVIREFEEQTGKTPAQIAEMLRVAPQRLYSWRSGQRPLPPYIEASMQAHAAALAAGWIPFVGDAE